MFLLILLLIATPSFACVEDCSKVLVAPARATKIILPAIPVKKPDAVKVSARVEDDETTSAVKCAVETENDVDTITCGW